jgi:hypothetical protein
VDSGPERPCTFSRTKVLALATACLWICTRAALLAQLDPTPRSLLEAGYDQALVGSAPIAGYAYYHYNRPAFLRTNVTLRIVVAPGYVDGELGFQGLLSPQTDLGIGLNGGILAKSHFEVREGLYLKDQSFAGHGGGVSLRAYHRFNPEQPLPISLILQGGPEISTYSDGLQTEDRFEVPEDRLDGWARIGIRVAGREPVLFPELGLEASLWFERQWKTPAASFGYDNDRAVSSRTDLYWLYVGGSWKWVDSGIQARVALVGAGSMGADRLNAWRVGGMLPLAGEFPLILPGYFYEELSARRLVHLTGSLGIPISADRRWQLRLTGATARMEFIRGFEQAGEWSTGAGPGLMYTSRSESWRWVLSYGHGFQALRNGNRGGHSIGLLFQYNFSPAPGTSGRTGESPER